MTRDQNVLFALYTHRVGFITRDQLLSVLKTMRPTADVDLGKSLSKRGVIDELVSDALWALVHAQIARCGRDARKAIGTVPMDEGVQQGVMAAMLAAAVKADGPTMRLSDVPGLQQARTAEPTPAAQVSPEYPDVPEVSEVPEVSASEGESGGGNDSDWQVDAPDDMGV